MTTPVGRPSVLSWPPRRAAFLLSGLVLLAALLVVFGALRAQSNATRWVLHSRQVLDGINATLSALTQAESGQRGYLLTGDPRLLAPYRSAVTTLPVTLDTLQRLSADNPVEVRALSAVRSEVGAKLAELARTIALHENGQSVAAVALVRPGRGASIMDRLRVSFANMRAEEDRLLAQRTSRAARANAWAFAAIITLGAIALLVLWVLRWLMARDAERLRLSEQRLAMTVTSVGDAVIATDADGRIERMNPVAERLTGWSLREASGQRLETVFRIVNEHSRAAIESPFDKVRREGNVVGLANHTLLIARDGTERPIEASDAPIRGADGSISGVVLVFKDASERYAAEQALRASEARFRGTFENAAVGIAHVALDGRFLCVNDALVAMTGYERAVLEARSFAEITHPDDLEADWTQAHALARGQITSYCMEKRYLRADHTQLWVNLTVGLQRTADGTPLFYISIIEDISERRRIEQALRESEARFHTLADNIPTLCWMADESGSIFWYNSRWYEYTGTTLGQMRGWGWQSVPDPAALPEVLERWRRSLASGESFEMVFPLKAADGTFRDFLTRIAPVRDERGRIVRWFGANTDVSEQRKAAAALQAADRRKDEFLAMLAHELRNPLAPIRNAVRLLKSAAPDAIQTQAREMIDRQSALLASLLDDLLDVSRITRGVIELRREVLDLRAIIEAVVLANQPLVERLHELRFQRSEEALLVEGDPTRLHQVLDNLLHNAIKYTDPGGQIELSAHAEGGAVVLCVADSGIGLAPESLDHVFDLFAQVHTPERGRSGLGIGLAVVKRVVAMHGGTVKAESAGLGRGSRFWVTLPQATTAPPAKSPVSSERLVTPLRPQPRVLLVDDQADIVESLALVLRASGYTVHTAEDGVAAVQLSEVLRPDVMLLDLGMPKMDGCQVAQWVRQQPWGERVQLIAVTGWGQAADRLRTHEAGFDAHLVKPVDPESLIHLLDDGTTQVRADARALSPIATGASEQAL